MMTSTLPPAVADADPRHRHVYRVLAYRDDWVDTSTLVDATGYGRGTVQKVCADLCGEGVAEWRHGRRDLRVKEYRAPPK